MTNGLWDETMVETNVSYILETERDRFVVIENVPARVCIETGERFFSPDTVEYLQETVWKEKNPKRIIETRVFEFEFPSRKQFNTVGSII